jgi:predicted nucleic acid-binding protein
MLDKIESGTRVFINIRQIENLKILEVTEEDFEVALSYSKKYGLLSNDATCCNDDATWNNEYRNKRS